MSPKPLGLLELRTRFCNNRIFINESRSGRDLISFLTPATESSSNMEAGCRVVKSYDASVAVDYECKWEPNMRRLSDYGQEGTTSIGQSSNDTVDVEKMSKLLIYGNAHWAVAAAGVPASPAIVIMTSLTLKIEGMVLMMANVIDCLCT